jgi:hypothetical protein
MFTSVGCLIDGCAGTHFWVTHGTVRAGTLSPQGIVLTHDEAGRCADQLCAAAAAARVAEIET